MDWMPNVEGIVWLADEVWPLVLENQPHAKLYLAGRNMPKNIFSRASASIVVEGAIDSPTQYMATKQIMAVPLFAGSGVRVKIIEGMALGKAIVATDLAVEGVDVSNGKNILLANSAQNFANAIIGLLKHPEAVMEIGANASAFIESNYRSAVVIKKLETFIAAI
jgi:glycosyltransferase involved in cell wall biosynthesis